MGVNNSLCQYMYTAVLLRGRVSRSAYCYHCVQPVHKGGCCTDSRLVECIYVIAVWRLVRLDDAFRSLYLNSKCQRHEVAARLCICEAQPYHSFCVCAYVTLTNNPITTLFGSVLKLHMQDVRKALHVCLDLQTDAAVGIQLLRLVFHLLQGKTHRKREHEGGKHS